MFIINTFSICFGHHYTHLQENKTCVTVRGVLRWFCWMWLVAVVGRCVLGCEHCVRTLKRSTPQPQPTTCSNTRLVLLKMGIMMPKTYWESIDNKHLTVASFWFSLSLHNLLTMHGHRNLKLTNCRFSSGNSLQIFKMFCTSRHAVILIEWNDISAVLYMQDE